MPIKQLIMIHSILEMESQMPNPITIIVKTKWIMALCSVWKKLKIPLKACLKLSIRALNEKGLFILEELSCKLAKNKIEISLKFMTL
jgi:hypothetical protein